MFSPAASTAAAAAARRASPRLLPTAPPPSIPGAFSVASITEFVFSCFSMPMAVVHIDVCCSATLQEEKL